MRLREPFDLRRWNRCAKNTAEIVHDHAPSKRKDAVQHLAGERRVGLRRQCQRHRGCRGLVVGERYRDTTDAMPIEQRLRPRIAYDLRRAIGVARDRKILGFNLPECEFARKELGASLLRREARCKARAAARAGATVGEFLHREHSRRRVGRTGREHALDTGDVDRVDAAARRPGIRRFRGLHRYSLERANDQRRVGASKTATQNQRGVGCAAFASRR